MRDLKNPQQNLHLLHSISVRLIKRIILVFKEKENLHFENQHIISNTFGIMNNKTLSKLRTLQQKTCADTMEQPKERKRRKKILALNAGKQASASHPQHNSPHNTPILKQSLFNSNTTFIFTAGCHRQSGV